VVARSAGCFDDHEALYPIKFSGSVNLDFISDVWFPRSRMHDVAVAEWTSTSDVQNWFTALVALPSFVMPAAMAAEPHPPAFHETSVMSCDFGSFALRSDMVVVSVYLDVGMEVRVSGWSGGRGQGFQDQKSGELLVASLRGNLPGGEKRNGTEQFHQRACGVNEKIVSHREIHRFVRTSFVEQNVTGCQKGGFSGMTLERLLVLIIVGVRPGLRQLQGRLVHDSKYGFGALSLEKSMPSRNKKAKKEKSVLW
jgi:hypothetical protein